MLAILPRSCHVARARSPGARAQARAGHTSNNSRSAMSPSPLARGLSAMRFMVDGVWRDSHALLPSVVWREGLWSAEQGHNPTHMHAAAMVAGNSQPACMVSSRSTNRRRLLQSTVSDGQHSCIISSLDRALHPELLPFVVVPVLVYYEMT